MYSIILSKFRGFYRNRVNLFFCVLFPSLLTYLLGNLLNGFYTGDDTIGSVRVAYLADEETIYPAAEQFLSALQEKKILTYEKILDLEKAQEMLAAGNADGILAEDKGKVTLYGGADEIKSRTLRTLLSGYLHMEATYKTALSYIPAQEAEGITGGNGREGRGQVTAYGLGASRSMIDYYAVVMLVMIIFMGCLLSGCENEDRILHTQERIALSPISPAKAYLAKMIGNLPLCTVQIAAMMLTSVFFFDAKYCLTWQDNVLLIIMFFVVSFAVLSVGSFFSMVVPIQPIAYFLPVTWIMLALSGSFSKDIIIPGVSEYMPTYIIQQAAFDLTIFGNRAGAVQVIIASGVVFVICFALGLIRISRRKTG